MGCNKERKPMEISVQKIDISNLTTLDMNEISTLKSIIPIETTDKCLIGQIEKVFVLDSCFIIWDRQSNRVLVFNIDGKYLYDIGKLGQGPKEFTTISYMYVDEDKKNIQIIDNASLKIVTYNSLGKFIDAKPIKHYLYSYYPTNDGYWGVNGHQNEKKYDLIFFNIKQNKISTGYFACKNNLTLLPTNNFTRNEVDKQLIYHYSYSDTVYVIDSLCIKPFLFVDFGKDKNTLDIHSTQFYEKHKSLEYIGRIHNLYMYGDKLFFSFYHIHGLEKPLDTYNVYISLNKGTCIVYQQMNHTDEIKLSPLPKIIGISNGNLIYQIIPGIIPDNILQKQLKGTQYNNLITTDSNPILIMYSLNKL